MLKVMQIFYSELTEEPLQALTLSLEGQSFRAPWLKLSEKMGSSTNTISLASPEPIHNFLVFFTHFYTVWWYLLCPEIFMGTCHMFILF